VSPYDAEGFYIDAPESFDFPAEVVAQVEVPIVPASDPFAYVSDPFPVDAWNTLSMIPDWAANVAEGAYDEAARVVASGFRNECLSVRLPGIPGAEYIASAADWWAGKAIDAFGKPVQKLGDVNDQVNYSVQQALGIPGAVDPRFISKFPARPGLAPGPDGFLVRVPNWQDIFTFNNDEIFDPRSKTMRTQEHHEELARSPTPPNLADVGVLLTMLDDVQDEASTLAIVLMIAEKVAGRTIPGVGWVATAADALSIIYALSNAATGSGMPGRAGKRRAHEKGKHTSKGMAGRLEEFRRSGKLKIGVGDLLQGLQASDSMFGVGIQIGGVMGFLQDAFWGGIRGAEFEARGPLWDPMGFTEYGRNACYRSPSLDQIHPKAYFMMANTALSVWKKASRVMPYLDVLGEHVLASTLTGLRNAETVLGPWLRSGVWVDPLVRAIELNPIVGGGVEAHETKGLRADEWLHRTVPAARVALTKAIGNVRDKGRQAFYESLVASTGWGFMGDLEPGAKVLDLQLRGFPKDAVTLLDVGRIPQFDLDD
jgi:hypothetical protein